MPVTRRGYLTTEFWATVLVSLGAVVAASANALPARYAAVASAAAVGLYSVGRGLAKRPAATVAPVAPPPPTSAQAG